MNSIRILEKTLRNLADKEHYLFSVSDFYPLFNNLSKSAITMLLSRAVKNKLLERACSGVYIYPNAGYEKGYELGLQMAEDFSIADVLDQLEDSQAQQQRHKSPHAAFALGYHNGVKDAYK